MSQGKQRSHQTASESVVDTSSSENLCCPLPTATPFDSFPASALALAASGGLCRSPTDCHVLSPCLREDLCHVHQGSASTPTLPCEDPSPGPILGRPREDHSPCPVPYADRVTSRGNGGRSSESHSASPKESTSAPGPVPLGNSSRDHHCGVLILGPAQVVYQEEEEDADEWGMLISERGRELSGVDCGVRS